MLRIITSLILLLELAVQAFGGEKPPQAPPVSRIIYVDGKPMVMSFPGHKVEIVTTKTTYRPIQAPAIQKTTTVTREVVTNPAPFTTTPSRSIIQATTVPSAVVSSYAYTGQVQYAAPTYIAAPTMVRYGITNRGVMQCDNSGCRLVSPR